MIEAVLPDTLVSLQNVTIVQDDPMLTVMIADSFHVITHS